MKIKKKNKQLLIIGVTAAVIAAAVVLIYYFSSHNKQNSKKEGYFTLSEILSETALPDKEYENLDLSKAIINIPKTYIMNQPKEGISAAMMMLQIMKISDKSLEDIVSDIEYESLMN